MPEIETQTEENPPAFVVLTPEEENKLTNKQFKEYRKELKKYKKELKRQKYNEYMRVYMSHYRRMKYKYDPNYREKVKLARLKYYYTKKMEKMGYEINNNDENINKNNHANNGLGLQFIL